MFLLFLRALISHYFFSFFINFSHRRSLYSMSYIYGSKTRMTTWSSVILFADEVCPTSTVHVFTFYALYSLPSKPITAGAMPVHCVFARCCKYGAFLKTVLLVGQWWDQFDQSNIRYKNSSKDVNKNTIQNRNCSISPACSAVINCFFIELCN